MDSTSSRDDVHALRMRCAELEQHNAQLEGRLALLLAEDAHGNDQARQSLEPPHSLHDVTRFLLLSTHARDIMLFMHPDGRIVDANQAAVNAYGYSYAELLSLRITDLRDPATHSVVAAQLTAANHRGILFETRHRRKDGSTFPVEVSSQAAVQGDERLLLSVIRDITERERMEQQRRLLADFSTLLTLPLDSDEMLQRVAELVVPEFAEWCAVHLLQDDGTVRVVAVSHADPEQVAQARAFVEQYPLDPSAAAGVAVVLRTGEPILYASIPDAALEAIAQDTEHLRKLQAFGLASALLVPLVARGHTYGALSLARSSKQTAYDEDDLALADELARRVALATDNIRLYKEVRIQRDRLGATLASIGDAVITTDTTGRITFMNRVAVGLTGWSEADAALKPLPEVFRIVDEATGSEVASPAERVLREGAVVGLANHTLLVARDGRTIPIEDSGAPIRDDQGQISGVVLVFHDITERRRAERELETSRNQFAVIVNGVTDGITLQRPDGELIFANQAAAHLVGFSSVEAMLAASTRQILQQFELMDEHGQLLPLVDLPGRRALQGEHPPARLLRFRVLASGVERWSFVRAVPVFDDDGQVRFAINIFHDVTEQQRAAAALQGYARQQEAIAHLGQHALAGGSLDELFEEAVRSVARMLSVDHVGLMERLPDQQAVRMRAGIGWDVDMIGRYTLQSGTGSLSGYTLLTQAPVIVRDFKTETRFTVPRLLLEHEITSSVSVIMRGQTDAHGVLNAFSRPPRDFSEHEINFLQAIANVLATAIERRQAAMEREALLKSEQQARRRAEESQQQLQFLAEASRVLATSLNDTTTLESLARLAVPRLADYAFVELLQPDGSIKRTVMMHADPTKQDLLVSFDRRFPLDPNAPAGSAHVIRTGQPDVLPEIPDSVLEMVAQSDEHLQLLRQMGFRSSMIVPLYARGAIIGDLALVMAESGRRFTDDDLAMAQELAARCALAIDNALLYQEARQAIRLRDEFLAIASHELKTPLTAVIGYVELLLRRSEANKVDPERQKRSLRMIAEQTRRLDRLVSDLLDLSRVQLGLFAIKRQPLLLDDLVQGVVESFQPTLHRHQLMLEIEAAPLAIEGDQDALEQLLQNLLSNAVKYSPDGGPIVVRVGRRGEQATLVVIDQGVGIPEEAQAQLFQRFFRADNVRPLQISGFGIGLYLVREIAARHGGTVEVSSVEHVGSTFTVSLPLITHPPTDM